jgi:hypothetical protein
MDQQLLQQGDGRLVVSDWRLDAAFLQHRMTRNSSSGDHCGSNDDGALQHQVKAPLWVLGDALARSEHCP